MSSLYFFLRTHSVEMHSLALRLAASHVGSESSGISLKAPCRWRLSISESVELSQNSRSGPFIAWRWLGSSEVRTGNVLHAHSLRKSASDSVVNSENTSEEASPSMME